MGGVLGSLLSALVSTVLPILIGFLKKKLPLATREEARTWVKGMLDELVQGLNAHGLVPAMLQGLEDPIEMLFAKEINAALDKVGW